MKSNYDKKKCIAIVTLSALALCLVGGLYWYMRTLGNTQPPVTQTESQPEPAVTVQEIKPESSTQPSSSVPEPEIASEPEPESSSAAATVTGDVQTKPSEGKPKSPAEATPPAEPPKDTIESSTPVENPDESGQCQPEHTSPQEPDQPQGGESNGKGQSYFPGFGWVDDGGENTQGTAPNAGTGIPVGEM